MNTDISIEAVGKGDREVKIIHLPNRNARDFFPKKKISDHIQPISLRRRLGDYDKYRLEEIGEIGSRLYRQIIALPGVEQVSIEADSVSVFKGEAFDWEDIQPAIIDILSWPNAVSRKVVINTVDDKIKIFHLSVDGLNSKNQFRLGKFLEIVTREIKGISTKVHYDTARIVLSKKRKNSNWEDGEENRVLSILQETIFDGERPEIVRRSMSGTDPEEPGLIL